MVSKRVLCSALCLLLAATGLLLGLARPAAAANPPPLQLFYLSLPEDRMLQLFSDNYGSVSPPPASPLRSITAIAIGTYGTLVYYDQWEDGGYDADIANPLGNVFDAATNPDGTQIWGDGVVGNGCAPSINNRANPCASPSDDILRRGDVITLDNWVVVQGSSGNYSRNPAQIYFDGGDKVGATMPVAVTRSLWPSGAGSLVADAVSVMPTERWGSTYVSPVGENIVTTSQGFEDVRWLVMAQAGGATIRLDANGDGDYVDPGDLNNYAMAEGARVLVDGIRTGARLEVMSGNPVQVNVLMADVGSNYENRFINLIPYADWENAYYSPVGTAGGSQCTQVWLYNPNAAAITVNYRFGNNTTGTVSVPGRSATGSPVVPDGYGAYFYTTGNPAPVFLGFSITDCATSGGDIYDWSTELYPVSELSPELLVGWAPGCTNESPLGVCLEVDGSPANTKSRSVVWVTPLANTTLYVDTDGSGISCPSGEGAERTIAASALQAVRIADDPDNVRHEFASANYSGNGPGNYSQNWSGPWVETGDDGSATGGAIRITGGYLEFRNVTGNEAGRSIARWHNLAGKGFARLSFRLYSTNIESTGDELALEVSSDGVNYTLLRQYTGSLSQRTEVFDLSPYASANTTIRFRIVNNFEGGESWRVDNVNIDYAVGDGSRGDFDMTGAYIRTCDDVVLAAAFGQYPGLSGSSDSEAMDLGMGVLPYGSRIRLTKAASAPFVAPGDLITYTYTVRLIQTFSTPVNNVEVVDDLCTPATYASGDDGDNTLEPGEVWTFRCATRLYADTINTAMAYALYGNERIRSAPDQATVRLTSAVGDRVWLDEDGDGDQDAGERGIPNVRVTLTGLDARGNPVSLVTYTDADGRYLFTRIPPSGPGGYTVSVDTTSLPGGLAANPTYDEDGLATPHTTVVVLTTGTEYTTADFGYNWASPAETNAPGPAATGAIGDRVWVDADGNGRQDPGEPGLAGVTVELVGPGPDGLFGTPDDVVLATTVSDYAGHYVFDGLSAGAYEVRVASVPAGYTLTGDPDQPGSPCSACDGRTTTPILLAPGDVFVNADFGYQPAAGNGATIGDTLWLDADRNGIRDAGEPGIAGVTVALIRDLNGNGVWDAGEPIIASDVTDTNGQYAFTGVPVADGIGSDDYLVWVNDTGHVLGELAAVYDADGAAPAAGLVTGLGISAVMDLGLAGNLDQDFGYAPRGHPAGAALIGDTIWLDRDGNGVFDPGEGLEGVLIRLLDAGGRVVARTVTNENGQYAFGGLAAGTYTVDITESTLPNGGVGLTNFADPDGGLPGRATVTLAAGEVNLALDFGYRATTPNTISGTLWRDTDANGVLDAGESGRFAGITVVLYDASGDIVGSTVTDANGNYAFTGLPDGTYRVDVTDEAHLLNGYWHSQGPQPGADNNSQVDPYTVTVGGGQTNATADFGYYLEAAEVGDRVWLDRDGDGVQDPDEPGIAGVRVVLTITYPNGSVVSLATATGAGGVYRFGNLLLDEDQRLGDSTAATPTYVVGAPLPPSMTRSPENAPGPDDQIDGDSDGVSEIATVVQGEVDPSYDFGFLGATDLGDLPDDTYGAPDYPTRFAAGPAHVVFPDGPDPDIEPDTTDGVPAVWLGTLVDTEPDGQPNVTASGDVPDEDGVTFSAQSWVPGGNTLFVLRLRSSGAATLYYGLWLDWNADGDFSDAGDGFYSGSAAVSGALDVPLTVAVPSSYIPGGSVYFRARVSDWPLAFGDYTGTRVNGEVEDYFAAAPTAVELVSFSARRVRGGGVLVAWETASELDTTGFYVWRGSSPDGPSARVNARIVPAQSLNGLTGGQYVVSDTSAGAEYYWLEELERTGKTNLYGPVRVEPAAPGYPLPLPVRLLP